MDRSKKNRNVNVPPNPDFLTLRQWKESPAGPEQIELNRLFENNLIGPTDAPRDVRKMHHLFMDFPARIFGLHFRKTKAKYGVGLARKLKFVIKIQLDLQLICFYSL